jgi:hypothetical protein
LVIGTDDTTAIKAAATAADALSPKGTVYLPRGGYVITDTPFVQSYASGRTTYCVVGDGSGQTTFFPAPSHAKGSNAFLQTSSNALSALYEGFAWDASHYNYSSNFAVMSPALASTLRDLRFTNHKGLLAFVYAFTGQNYIDRCHFEAAGSEGIHVTGSAVITNSYCGNHFGNGVFVDSGASLTVIGGILDECTYRTVYVASTGKFAAIGATLYGNGSTYPVLETAGEARIDNCRVEPFNTGYSEPGIKCASGGLLQINNCTVKGYGTNGHAVDVAGGEAHICNSSLTSTGTGHALNIASGATARLTCTKLTGSGAGDGLANAGTCHDGAGNVADSKSGTAPVTTAL